MEREKPCEFLFTLILGPSILGLKYTGSEINFSPFPTICAGCGGYISLVSDLALK